MMSACTIYNQQPQVVLPCHRQTVDDKLSQRHEHADDRQHDGYKQIDCLYALYHNNGLLKTSILLVFTRQVLTLRVTPIDTFLDKLLSSQQCGLRQFLVVT